MSKIIVVGSINMDLVSNVEEFAKPGETISAIDFNKYPGGKGANQAVALARNNEEVYFIGAIGNDENGFYLKNLLGDNHINTNGITIKENIPTGTAFISVNSHHENSIIIVHGANYALSGEDVIKQKEAFKNADAIIMQLEVNDEVLIETSRIAKEFNIPLFLNPAPSRKIPEEVLMNTFAITPNESELASLTSMPCDTIQDIQKAAELLKDRYHMHVIVTMGSKGALIHNDNDSRIVEGFKVEAVDTTAAGDSFNGALISAYLESHDFMEAVRYANAFAALSVTKNGAIPSIPYKDSVMDFLKNI